MVMLLVSRVETGDSGLLYLLESVDEQVVKEGEAWREKTC